MFLQSSQMNNYTNYSETLYLIISYTPKILDIVIQSNCRNLSVISKVELNVTEI